MSEPVWLTLEVSTEAECVICNPVLAIAMDQPTRACERHVEDFKRVAEMKRNAPPVEPISIGPFPLRGKQLVVNGLDVDVIFTVKSPPPDRTKIQRSRQECRVLSGDPPEHLYLTIEGRSGADLLTDAIRLLTAVREKMIADFPGQLPPFPS